jgi:hypothetical protein
VTITEQGDVVDVCLQRMTRERMADNIRMFELFAQIKADLPEHYVGGKKPHGHFGPCFGVEYPQNELEQGLDVF